MSDEQRPYYGRARQVAALLLIGTACALVLIGATTGRGSDPVSLGLMLGTASIMLAVEGARALLDRRP